MVAILDVTLGPQPEDFKTELLNLTGALRVLTPYYLRAPPSQNMIKNAIKAYGATAIAARSVSLLEDSKYSGIREDQGLFDLIMLLQQSEDRDLQVALAEAALPVAVCRAYWRLRSAERLTHDINGCTVTSILM